ncbi:MAG: DUF4926 domain-containing protein [Anaerosomatales bacterium]|nr:DUF4926 domain-containing protein [Anaerosomatales bacterium]MDT8434922.1 DUF4926 domain-containing protein [Anaerosomatales bacterium]
MTTTPRELDVVEVTTDQPSGLVEGARGAVVAVRTRECTVEFIDADGFTVGLFEIPTSDLEVVVPYVGHAMTAREE